LAHTVALLTTRPWTKSWNSFGPAFGSTGAEAIFPVVSPSTGEVIGTIDVESDRKNAFTPEDDAFLSDCARVLLPLWLSRT
jgi:putative methionine-R-sulfoxide reductase with GAF domain